ncbi:unnamed protein product [Moneuplotes crassus]|uniref:Uncharacterized protein n=3 Tax=Euplotes crassus TaxID=5936 RepID=A0AAD1XQ60_EUPCR|nr:unnamed protein product [Moneuplotes crassus]
MDPGSSKPLFPSKDVQLEKKVPGLYKQIDGIDPKKNIKTLKKSIASSRSVVEELFYRLAYAYLLNKMNKTEESEEIIEEVLQKIITDKIYDKFLVDHFVRSCKELDYMEKSVRLSEAKFENNPDDKDNALQMFDIYVATNNFMKMNMTSMKIFNTFNFSEYQIHGIQSMYMLSQSEQGMPNTIDLAFMFANKYMQKYSDEDKVFPCDGKLFLKIMKKKGMTQQALEFIEKHPETFNGDLEKSREIISILHQEIDQLKKGGKLYDLKLPQCKLISEVRNVIKENYEDYKEFNSIYDLYELLINTLVDLLKEEVAEQDLLALYDDTHQSEAKESEVFNLDQGENEYNIESIKNLWTSLIYYQDFELEENKTTEAHNLRKASILSQLYLMHRLVLAGIKYEHENSSKNVFGETSLIYAKRYLQLSSVVYDLKGYFPYFDSKFVEPLDKIVTEEGKSLDPEADDFKARKLRYHRKRTTIHKIKKMLGLYKFDSDHDYLTSPQLQEMLEEYKDCLSIEEAPEKGERRVSDDYIYIIDEIFSDYYTDINHIPNPVKLFRINILEYCLSQSIYNFDIALRLTKIYQDCNMNSQVVDKLNYFEFKGIQMESCGYIPMRQLILSPNYEDVSYWYSKYGIFHKRNSKDIEGLKSKAMQSQNYDKVDEFYQYQDYLDKSYFSQIVNFLKHTSQIRDKLSNEAWLKDFCKAETAKEYSYSDAKFNNISDEQLSVNFTRTQDLGVWVGKYTEIPKYSEIKEAWRNSEFYTTAQDDPIFGYIKFNNKCNYKPGLANSLSLFEHPLMLQIYKGLITLSSHAYSKTAETEKKDTIRDLIDSKISTLRDLLSNDPGYFGHQDEQELTRLVLDFFNGWLSITHLTNKFSTLKELKSNQEALSKAIEDLQEEVSANIESIDNSIFEQDIEKLKGVEEEKFEESAKNVDYNSYFSKKFGYTQIISKFMHFVANYCLGYYLISFSALGQAISGLGPKKKKASFNETPLAKVINLPLKESLKKLKGFINTNIEVYSCKDLNDQLSNYIENVSTNSAKLYPFPSQDEEKITKELNREEIALVSNLKLYKGFLKNITF